MKKLLIRERYDCNICFDEREYEVAYAGYDGEPRYQIQKCECTLMQYETVPVNVMLFLEEIQTRADLMSVIATKDSKEMVWGRGGILSPTLPSSFLVF